MADPRPVERQRIYIVGTNLGVPGGIPTNRTLFVNVRTTTNPLYQCAGDGVTDDNVALERAMKDCPANKYVYVPAGIYLVSARMLVRFNAGNWTLRGDGKGQTILKCNGGYLQVGSGQDSGWPAELTVLAGATKGSSYVDVADTSTVQVGNIIHLKCNVRQPYEHNIRGQSGSNIYFPLKVASKTSTRINFSPDLPLDMSAMSPTVLPFNLVGTELTKGVGIEELTFDLSGGNAPWAYKLEQAWGCWTKNVEIYGAPSRQVYFDNVSMSEFRGMRNYGGRGAGSNHEGFDFARGCSWNLVEDGQYTRAGYPQIIFGDSYGGCHGNVVGYVFCDDAVGPAGPGEVRSGHDISFNHGPHNMFNLLEGSILNQYIDDRYFGSSSHNSIHRCWVTAKPPRITVVEEVAGIKLKATCNQFSVTGCILGCAGMSNLVYEVTTSGYSYSTTVPLFELGYPAAGNNGFTGTLAASDPPDYSAVSTVGTDPDNAKRDLTLSASTLRHGNYDYSSGAIVWDSTIEDHDLPDSLYTTKAELIARGVVFGSLPWPTFEPASPPGSYSNTTISTLPAGYRQVYGEDPPDSPPVTRRVRFARAPRYGSSLVA